jgi:hypothetical protein
MQPGAAATIPAPMGQFALGLRSLLFKAAVFVVMAALLAWALGGTLWPRAHVVEYDAVTAGGHRWWWRLSVGGTDERPVRWTMMRRSGVSPDQRGPVHTFPPDQDPLVFADVAGPVSREQVIAFAGLLVGSANASWRLYETDPATMSFTEHAIPDRLAAEQQLARFAAGLPIQDAATIRNQRAAVLDPPQEMADEGRRD